jgi:hypothetical protein
MTHPSELEFDENHDNVEAAARILEKVPVIIRQ